MSEEIPAQEGDYSGGNVQILRDADHIRRRPGVYIGDVSTSGLHHLVYELVYNAVDEALAGHCKTIHVEVDVDGSVLVRDDGRGIPVDMHAFLHKSRRENHRRVVFTQQETIYSRAHLVLTNLLITSLCCVFPMISFISASKNSFDFMCSCRLLF